MGVSMHPESPDSDSTRRSVAGEVFQRHEPDEDEDEEPDEEEDEEEDEGNGNDDGDDGGGDDGYSERAFQYSQHFYLVISSTELAAQK